MAKLARLPANDRAPEGIPAQVRRVPRAKAARYFAFLSYSHKDEELADWLHCELEEFRVPSNLVGRLTENGAIPKRLTPVFRDAHELAAADDLGDEILSAIAASHFLVVLCSPNAARSHWTNAEIEAFKRSHPEGCVLAAIASGEPFASEIPGREDEECFPPALRQKFDRRGRPTGKRAEPLAADLREDGESRRLGFIKLVAGMLGVGLDDLLQRETTRRQRRLAVLAALSLGGMAITSTLAVTAIQARDSARDQRREAEGLVAFMLGDLKDKLEPIGRLDALDGVGSRVLAYYSKQDSAELSDAALLQRSQALSLTAQVSYLRGDLDAATRLYREATQGTGEAIRRNPSDPQRLFDHAQNVFWIADLARQRGDGPAAEQGAREYQSLAQRMVALGPDNMKWRMEEQDADAELGIVLLGQRRFGEAAAQFEQALQTIQALAAADPANSDYQKSLVEMLAWVADAQMANGRLDRAIAMRERHVALLGRLVDRPDADVHYRQKLIPAEQGLGRLYAMRGQGELAARHLAAAVAEADALIPLEPKNAVWVELGFAARLALADYRLQSGRAGAAAVQAEAACAAIRSLLAKDSAYPPWRAGLANCDMTRAAVALAAGSTATALTSAEQALAVARSVKSDDKLDDQFRLARAYRMLGDVRLAMHDRAGAGQAWSSALAALPRGVAEKPLEMDEHARILQRLGRAGEAQPIATRLNAMGFRRVA
jgi:tetratricopeptide (TPR) repeat protein